MLRPVRSRSEPPEFPLRLGGDGQAAEAAGARGSGREDGRASAGGSGGRGRDRRASAGGTGRGRRDGGASSGTRRGRGSLRMPVRVIPLTGCLRASSGTSGPSPAQRGPVTVRASCPRSMPRARRRRPFRLGGGDPLDNLRPWRKQLLGPRDDDEQDDGREDGQSAAVAEVRGPVVSGDPHNGRGKAKCDERAVPRAGMGRPGGPGQGERAARRRRS